MKVSLESGNFEPFSSYVFSVKVKMVSKENRLMQ